MELDVTQEEAGDQPVGVLAVSGEVDHANYRALIDRARELHASGVRRLVIDLSGVTYLGSSALVALHSIALIFAGLEPPDPEGGRVVRTEGLGRARRAEHHGREEHRHRPRHGPAR